MKKTALKKVSKSPISKLQKKIWELCRLISDKIYSSTCYTCGATNLFGHNKQLGHMWAKASVGAFLKYDLRILRWQCMRCNQFMGGRGAYYYAKMLKEIGEEKMAQLQKDRQVTVNAYNHYLNIYQEYKKLYEKYEQENLL